MGRWYTRPVLFVAEVEAASAFYVERLGFQEAWRFPESDGRIVVAQVGRDETEIILSSQWPDKVGKGMLFIELTAADWRALPGALAARDVASSWGHWGYRTLIVDDPDGNQLFFPDPEDPGSM
jgi:catechol 2,3-dioxygenase-like lactoylglutathione lyase family enzyme